MRQLRLHLFGPFQASIDGIPVRQFEAATARGLLAYLAINAGRPHSRESLAALLWNPDAGSSGLTNFRSALRRVRVALDDQEQPGQEPFLLVQRDTVQWNSDAHTWVDVREFENLLAQTGRHPHGQVENCSACVALLEQAAALYRGPFLANLFIDHLGFEEWQRAEQERYHRLVLQALNILAGHHLVRQAYGKAEEFARRQLSLEAWNEEAHRQLMATLAASGQRSAALAQYEACRRVLAAELDAQPDAETHALYESIRAAGHRAHTANGANPYRSLQPFTVADAARFFGREQYTEALLAAVHCQPFVAVIGPSGSGKSSLIQAGLLAKLAALPAGAWFAGIGTPCAPLPAPRHILQFRPGTDPFLSLSQAALQCFPAARDATTLAGMLRRGQYTLADLARSIAAGRRTAPGPNATGLLIVIDPFEELFTLCDDAATRGAFLDFLFAALAPAAEPGAGSPPIACVAGLRADFMAQALQHRGLAAALRDNSLVLGSMNGEELRRAVVEPARMQGVNLEPGLLERLLQDVSTGPGYLALLQFALARLWERQMNGRLTHAAYTDIGGMGPLLAAHCEQTFNELAPVDQARAQHIFLHMIQIGDPPCGNGMAYTARPVTRAELHPDDWPLVQRLASARLLVTDSHAAGVEMAVVVHESLLDNWARLRGWIEDDRGCRGWQEQLLRWLRQRKTDGPDNGGLLRESQINDMVSLVFRPEADIVVSVSADGSLREWRADATLAELQQWMAVNRYVPELTAQQRGQYGLE
jgi:DNA-binding SARP family transcriptional activator